jgi:hypothetical protein
MTNFIVSVLAFLLMLFPNWGNVRYAYLTRTNTPAIVAPKIIDAVKSKDISALEAMMCKNIKQNTTDLRGEISKLVNAIEGEIIEFKWLKGDGGSYSLSGSDGKKISQVGIDFSITTTVATYLLGSMWETANNFNKDEVGFRTIGLGRLDPRESLVIISATNGIGARQD